MRRPNVLLIITEQQQGQLLDPGSPCRLPALEGLAGGGVRFSRAHTTNAICSPARASMFTGTYPSTHGMVDCTHTVSPYRADFDDSLATWSRSLSDLGYRTGYFGAWHVERSERPDRFGFAEHEPPNSPDFREHRRRLGLPPRPEDFALRYAARHKGYRDFPLYGAYREPAEGTGEHYLYSRAIDFIGRGRPEQPWCAVISTDAVHDPYLVPESYYAGHDPRRVARPASFDDDLHDRPAIYRRMRGVWRDLTWDNYAEATACYYAFCSLVDDQVARVLRALEETGQAEDTVVIYTADHGEMMGAHGLMLKGVFPFEEGYRVPLLVRWPGAGVAGRVCDSLVSTCDLAPTIAEMAGAEPLPRAQARSLVPLLRAEEDGWEDEAYAEFHGQRFFFTQRILWRGHHKYVFNGFDCDELYDLEADPHERRNLAGDPAHAALAEEMAARMWARTKALGDHNMYNAQYGMFRFAPVGPEGDGVDD